MSKFNSLKARFVSISAIALVFSSAYIFADFIFTHHIKGNAATINTAGRQRMIALSMTTRLHLLLGRPSLPDSETILNGIRERMAEYENGLYSLRDGNKILGIKPIPARNEDAVSKLNTLIDVWQNKQKPAILDILNSPPENKGDACARCHSVVRNNLGKIEALVSSLETNYEMEIKRFDTVRGYTLVLIFFSGIVFVFYMLRYIVYPLNRFSDAAKKIKEGDLDVRVDVKGGSEIEEFGNVFNSMAQNLKALFQDRAGHLKEIWALADTSNVLSAAAPAENIYDLICDIILRDFDIKMAWIGLIEEGNYDVWPVAHAGAEDGYLSNIKIRHDDSPYGMGPTGMAIKKKVPMVVNDIATEPAFEQWRDRALKRGYSSSAAVPLISSEGKVMGTINLYSGEPQFFTDERVRIFRVFANQAATAIENRLLIYGLEHKVREKTGQLETANRELEKFGSILYKLFEVSFTTDARAHEFAELILREAAEMFDVDAAAVGEFAGNEWVAYAVADRKGLGIDGEMRFSLNEIYCGIVRDTKRPLVISDAALSEKFKDHPDLLKYGVVSYLGVPLFIGEELFGVLCTFSRSPHDYTDYDLFLHQLLSRRMEFELIKEKYEEELRAAIVQATAADRAKSEFLVNMSHELKTPLNAIIGFSDAMLNGIYGQVSERHREYLNDILNSGKRLLSLVNDILDLSRIGSGSISLELSEFSLRELIMSGIAMFRERITKHNIRVEYLIDEDLNVIVADQRKLKQIMSNLLSNAIKFTPDGGSVHVSARRVRSSAFGVQRSEFSVRSKEKETDAEQFEITERRTINAELNGNFVEISVADSGIGIDEKDMPRLFQPFQQLESPLQKRYEGAGLGLYLTKKLIELHGGRLRVESEKGRDSKFTFLIPIKGNV